MGSPDCPGVQIVVPPASPPYLITPDQRRALEALEWLYDERDISRRQGRTWVLALSYVRRLVLGRATELEVEDHFQGHAGASVLMDYIVSFADGLGLDIEVRRGSSRIRLRYRPEGQDLLRVVTALTSCGHRAPLAQEFMVSARMEGGVLRTAKIERDPSAARPPTNAPPPKTLWDHLHDSDDSDGI